LRNGVLPEARRYRACEAIFTNATRQARLIDELLDMARIMAGKLQLHRTDVDPREIAAGAVEIVQIAADAKRIRIGVDVAPGTGAFRADGARLQQVLWNLLSNAVKFTPEDGTIAVAIRRRGRWGEIVVGFRDGHRERFPAVRLRTLPPGRRFAHAHPRRTRARSRDREATGPGARRRHRGRESGRRAGHHVP